MRSSIALLLVLSLLAQGCSGFYALDESAHPDLKSLEKERITVRLEDGSWVESGPWEHLEVAVPSHLVFGKGRFTARSYVGDSVAGTLIPWSSIDSSKVLPPREGEPFRCWLADGSTVTFRQGEYVILTPGDGVGYWVKGVRRGAEFQRVIPVPMRTQVTVKRFSPESTAILVGGLAMIPVIIVSSWAFTYGW